MKDRHRTPDDARAHAIRTVRRIGWDGQHARSICAKTRPFDAPLASLEVCAQKVNHEGPCFLWDES